MLGGQGHVGSPELKDIHTVVRTVVRFKFIDQISSGSCVRKFTSSSSYLLKLIKIGLQYISFTFHDKDFTELSP